MRSTAPTLTESRGQPPGSAIPAPAGIALPGKEQHSDPELPDPEKRSCRAAARHDKGGNLVLARGRRCPNSRRDDGTIGALLAKWSRTDPITVGERPPSATARRGPRPRGLSGGSGRRSRSARRRRTPTPPARRGSTRSGGRDGGTG